ncbi:MAG: hypothetical protein K2X28_07525 [Alphaproteobacteria bacterium]|nr:hypothetical protein [Alphaproteobacteria bacterium]
MNILKKLKLALLATSVMFFPKGGHAIMGADDEKPSAGQSKPAPRPEVEAQGFTSLLPAGPSNPAPKADASPLSSSLKGPQKLTTRDIVYRTFERLYLPNEECDKIATALSSLNSNKSSEEVKVITDAIRDNLVKQFLTPALSANTYDYHVKFYGLRDVISMRVDAYSSVPEIITHALTLSKEEIEDRSKALRNMIKSTLYPWKRSSNENNDSPSLSDALNDFGLPLLPVIASVFKELSANQINNRTSAIKSHLLSFFPTAPISTRGYGRAPGTLTTLRSLIKLPTQQITDRITPMNILRESIQEKIAYESEEALWGNPIKLEANSLSTDELKLRVDKGISILTESPGLKPITLQLLYLSLKFNPADFDSFVSLAKNHENLVVPMLSAENSSSLSSFSLREIYEAAEQQHTKNYFFDDFLPKMEARFSQLNGFSPPKQLLEVMFPSQTSLLKDFSLQSLQKRMEESGIYRDLFQPPSPPEFQPSRDIGSSPASSSGPLRSESMGRSYEDYFRGDFLQKMGDSFRKYNNSTLSNDAILKVLFPNLPEGEVPSLEIAKVKFSDLAKSGRPYAKLFNFPEE